jgi:hypothetical protein
MRSSDFESSFDENEMAFERGFNNGMEEDLTGFSVTDEFDDGDDKLKDDELEDDELEEEEEGMF